MPECSAGGRIKRVNIFVAPILLSVCLLLAVDGTARADVPPFAKSKFAVPVTSASVGEAKPFLDSLSKTERHALMLKGVTLHVTGDESKEMRKTIRALVLVKQPREVAFKLLTDPSKQAEFLPRLVSSKTISRTATTEKTEFLLKIAFTSLHYRVDHRWWPGDSRIAWMLDSSFDNPMKLQTGYYYVYSVDDNWSLLEYGTNIDTGWFVPDVLQNYLSKREVPEALAALKKYIDSGGTWRKDVKSDDKDVPFPAEILQAAQPGKP